MQEYLDLLRSTEVGLGMTLFDIVRSGVAFVVLWLGLSVSRTQLVRRLRELSRKTKNTVDDMLVDALESVRDYFYLLFSLLVAVNLLPLPERWADAARAALLIVIVWQVTSMAQHAIRYGLHLWGKHHGDRTIVQGLSMIAHILLWVTAVLLVLSNLGFNINTLVASLGIGGVAVAFALQQILADVFSSFSIYFDKPFKIGDSIQVGQHGGTVEKIGLKTTRMKLWHGEEVVIPNAELTGSRIHNYETLERRRVTHKIGVTYDTPARKLEKIPIAVRKIISGQEDVTFGRCYFTTFGDSSLVFDIMYYVDTPDYVLYLERQQAINLAILKAFEKDKIEIAFPTQTIYMKKG